MTLTYVAILLAAVLYAGGAMLVKRATELGVGAWRTAFIANLVATVIYLPFLSFGGTWRPELWWQPVIVAVCYVAGQMLTFLSFEYGDISVATPVLGLKILLVAALVALTGEALHWQLWAAAMLATLGIVLLNRRSARAGHHHVALTLVTAGGAAACYAVLDVLVQRWSPLWGLGRFLPAVSLVAAVLSFGFVPRFRAPLTAIPWATWRWLLGGTVIIGVQSATFVALVAAKGHVASINVVYSSRGLWTVILVWWLGHWVHSREQHLERAVLTSRLTGALLMLAAIALILL